MFWATSAVTISHGKGCGNLSNPSDIRPMNHRRILSLVQDFLWRCSSWFSLIYFLLVLHLVTLNILARLWKIGGILTKIFFRMPASKLSSIASGVSSWPILARRCLIISSLVGLIEKHVSRPARRRSISARICGLPVANLRVLGDLPRISLSESRSLARTFAQALNAHKRWLCGCDSL